MVGHQEIQNSFIKLAKNDSLSHGYIFFGEPQVGKFTFALNLANYLEFDDLKGNLKPLTETLAVQPIVKESGERSIGIDQIRDLKKFLFEKPVNSKYRFAIINDAEMLTDQAQNAILKIAEEPPVHAVLILIVASLDSLLKTVQSRFQKIYFGRVPIDEIKSFLSIEYKLNSKESEELAKASFGRPGRATNLVKNDGLKQIIKEAKEFIIYKNNLKDLISELADLENRDKIEPFLNELIAELSKDVKKNYSVLKSLIYRLRMLKEWNTNKRIQLEAALGSLSKK